MTGFIKFSSASDGIRRVRDAMDRFSYLDDVEGWTSRTPDEVAQSDTGICYDTAVLQDKMLTDAGIEHKNVFAASDRSIRGENGTDPTHTFVIHKAPDGKWRWIEGSWEPHRTNRLESADPDKLIARVVSLLEADRGVPYSATVVDRFPGPGKTLSEFYGELIGKSRPTFQDVEGVYDSLPEEQKRLLSPRGRFVDSPFTAVRVATPSRDGFAEAYYMNGGRDRRRAFVTLAVKPEAQGKGKSRRLMDKLLARAAELGIDKLVYRLDSSNDASRRVAERYAGKPHRVFKDSEEYIIGTGGRSK